mmetsp:Transcript_12279/g.18388  ORF Transcript_12279/g.18388 Transcript_12279/m.18388 type:complete len:100 (-) Transcript_12279:37-336(-)
MLRKSRKGLIAEVDQKLKIDFEEGKKNILFLNNVSKAQSKFRYVSSLMDELKELQDEIDRNNNVTNETILKFQMANDKLKKIEDNMTSILNIYNGTYDL